MEKVYVSGWGFLMDKKCTTLGQGPSIYSVSHCEKLLFFKLALLSMTKVNTVWAVDFETPVGSSIFFSFFLFLGKHWQKETINKVCTMVFQSLLSIHYLALH
jgi:hypothetical protein